MLRCWSLINQGNDMSLLIRKETMALLLAAAFSCAVASSPAPRLTSSVALVSDAETGEVLMQKSGTQALPIASITKLMTGIVIVDAGLDLDEVITITRADVDLLRFSSSRLPVGARLTRGQALHLALMSSENRAAHALARTFPGGAEVFVRIMNNIGREIGMKQTRFTDPTGLCAGNRSTAADLGVLLSAAHARPAVRAASVSTGYTLRIGRERISFQNTNRLVRSGHRGVEAQKTGFINEAGRTLVIRVQGARRTLNVVLLGAPGSEERAADALRLLRWSERV